MVLISGRVMVAYYSVSFVRELGYWQEIRNFETECKHEYVFHLPRSEEHTSELQSQR